MSAITVRPATLDDDQGVIDVNRAAFGCDDEARIFVQLRREGALLASFVAERDSAIVGHLARFFIMVGSEDGDQGVAVLGPMSVIPELQGQGVGSRLVQAGIDWARAAPLSWIFVLGHPDYYPRFGFSAIAAERFRAPWGGPAFMALKLRDDGPASGRLIYPKAFGD